MDTTIAFPAMVKKYRTANGLTMEQLAERIGKTKSTISKWESGTRSPKIYEIEEIAHFFGISPQVMMFGVDQKPSQLSNSTVQAISDTVVQLHHKRQENVLCYATDQLQAQESEVTVDEPQATYYTYDYYDQPASAGTGQYLNDVQVEQIELPVDIEADFVVPIYGDSMEPEYHSGDYVFVKLSVDLSSGDIGVFELYGDAYIKELIIDDSGACLHSFNTEKYKDIPIDADSDFRIIGEVVGRYTEK
ncbi:XRE family transcriptional regulator [Streptococcus gallolyticus]|uniref:XRE family transcriptional regulator n=1 Tax=Streptococcus gallolyticus TaxID=315405 RepID=A0A368UI68_9STRE|nr:S24 family peptidase [Streptococcus gallolyticus]RCW17663.1 XRE family transcriptional regulator [Streptococcus gallolyticus]